MTSDAAPTRAQRFASVVAPAARRAGYEGHGAGARLARDTGITESSVSRMLRGEKIPEVRFFEPLATAIGISVRDLLIESGTVSAASLTESDPSQVRSSTSVTPDDAAAQWGITDPVNVEMLRAVVERLRRTQADPAPGNDHNGGAHAAER
ncbi:helix-turn-helix domain-containing protein [Actinacidiphila glaucinigra]|uniref:helix-turn-helix domain-containing protein n=1 Tax=Actinacidiphila glaucinigra TaxID=235986 RepID=UPI0035E0E0CD